MSILFFILLSVFSSPAMALEGRNKVEELFIWKISDELNLSVPDEKNFSDFIRGMNQRRARINDDLQKILAKLALGGSLGEKEKALGEHRKLLKAYSELAVEEADKIQKMFGSEKTSRYFVLKNDLTNRLKSMLTSTDRQSANKLGPPKVIEEN